MILPACMQPIQTVQLAKLERANSELVMKKDPTGLRTEDADLDELLVVCSTLLLHAILQSGKLLLLRNFGSLHGLIVLP